jgi:hypothetical protein
MMKKILAVILVALLALPAFSQLSYGLKAGVSTTSLTMSDIKTITSSSSTYTVEALTQAKYGFHGGAFVRISLLGLYIQPELLLSTRSNEYKIKNTTIPASITSVNVKQNFFKLDIPVMIGYKLGPLRLNVGPAASLLLNTPKELINDQDLKNNYSKLTFGYQAGIGVDILNRITFDIRYEGSLKKFQNQIQGVAGGTKVNLDDRPNAFLLSFGLFF